MQVRLALVPVLALLATAAPYAQAAPAPACNTITDAKGDTFVLRAQDGTAPGPQEDGLDLVSGDLASDGKVVTGVVRLSKLSRAIATSPTGLTVGVDFTIGSGEDSVRLQAVLVPNQPDRFEVSTLGPDALPNEPATFVGEVTGVVDEAKNEVRIHAPAAMLAPYGAIKAGVKLVPNELAALLASRAVPAVTKTPGQPMTTRGPFADIAPAGKVIAVGAKSCVVPGK